MFDDGWEVGGVVGWSDELGGHDAGDSVLDVGGVVEEEEIDPREADEGVDVEEEDAVEDGDAFHFKIESVESI